MPPQRRVAVNVTGVHAGHRSTTANFDMARPGSISKAEFKVLLTLDRHLRRDLSVGSRWLQDNSDFASFEPRVM